MFIQEGEIFGKVKIVTKDVMMTSGSFTIFHIFATYILDNMTIHGVVHTYMTFTPTQ